MYHKNVRWLGSVVLLVGTLATNVGTASADDSALPKGSWKLVLLAFGDDEFAIFNIADKDNKLTATMTDAQSFLKEDKVSAIESKDGNLKLTLSGGNGRGADSTFKGALVKDGADAGKYLGTFNFRGNLYPVLLETTRDSKVAAMKRNPASAN